MAVLTSITGLLIDPFADEAMRTAAIAAVVIGGLCAVVGSLVVIRGNALMVESFAHGVLPGLAIAVLLTGAGADTGQAEILLGALAGSLATVAGTAWITRRGGLHEEIATAVTFSFMLALGVLLVSATDFDEHDLGDFLFGDVLSVAAGDLPLIILLSAAVLLAVRALYKPIVLVAFDPRRAASMGLPVSRVELAISLLMAVTVVIGFRVVGSLLVFGLLVAPPAAAAVLTRRIPAMMATAAGIAAASAPIGLMIAWHAELEAGPAIVLVAVGICLVILALRPARQ